MNKKKLFIALSMALALAFSMIAFAGCGKSDADVIKDDIKSQLEAIKKKDGQFVEQLKSQIGAEDLSAYGIDAEAFINSFLDGFDYTIGDVKVDGNTATAQITIKMKSLSAYQTAIGTAVDELLNEPDVASLSQDELMSRLGQVMISALDKVEPVESSPITLTYNKVDNKWTEAESNQTAVANALYGGNA
jgi:hypothetical protein